MKFTALRRYIKHKCVCSPHELEDGEVVIDGDSFFHNTYKNSGCQFVLGPDCDRYADFIISKLSIFPENNVKCHVIFSGATKQELEKTLEVHQSVIKNRNDVAMLEKVGHFQPLLVKDVQKQVLDEMDIKYFVCEYDSIDAIVGVARKFKCPVLTNKIEYSLFGVSCIPPNSLEYEKHVDKLKCKIYEHEEVKSSIGVYSKMPILLTLLNEDGDYLPKLTEIIEDGGDDMVYPVIKWVKRLREAALVSTISNSIDDTKQNKAFKEVHERIQNLYLYPLCNLAVKYFQRDRAHGMFKDDRKWFAKGVSDGRIAVPYVNLKKKGIVCGSLVMNDSARPDALLAAIDIVVYSHCLLTNSRDSTITFIGRKFNRSSTQEIETHWNTEISNRDIFTKHRVGKKLKWLNKDSEVFKNFLNEVIPGYDFKDPLLTVPEECHILILTLVYYVFKKNIDFVNGAYCVLLSYVMLGPVSKKIDALKKTGSFVPNSTNKYVNFYNGLQFLFQKVNLRENYNSNTVHDFSEFQHCLQYMNYLNKMCGEKIPCTVYQDTYNATFIYNTFLFMKDKEHLMSFLEDKFGGSNCLMKYKNIVNGFENCLSAVKVFAIKDN